MTCASLESSCTFAVSLPSLSHQSHPTVSADRSPTHLPNVGDLRPRTHPKSRSRRANEIRKEWIRGFEWTQNTRTFKESCPETNKTGFLIGTGDVKLKIKTRVPMRRFLDMRSQVTHRTPLHFGFCKSPSSRQLDMVQCVQ